MPRSKAANSSSSSSFVELIAPAEGWKAAAGVGCAGELLVPLLGAGSTTAVSAELAAVRLRGVRDNGLTALGAWQAALRQVLAAAECVVSIW